MDIYVIYKENDLAITGLVFGDKSKASFDYSENVSENSILWEEEKTVIYEDETIRLIKTFEDVASTINNLMEVAPTGVVSYKQPTA